MENSEKIKEFLNQNNGYITTADILNLGISKSLIPTFIKTRLIRKVHFGLYIDNNIIEDDFYILQFKYPNVIYSHLTALYLLKLSSGILYDTEITIKRKDKVRGDYKVHYITDKLYDLGIMEINSPYGNPVKVYNAERSICDMLREKEKLDIEFQKKILTNYFNSKEKNIETLLEYATVFNIFEKVQAIIEIMNKK